MSARVLSGKEISAAVRQDIAAKARDLEQRTGVTPGLAVVIVGEDPASQVYVRNKEKGCAEVGFYSEMHRMGAETTTEELLAKLEEIKANPKIHGILVQLPLPEQIDEKAVLMAIPPQMDVDAFHPENVGHIMIGDYHFLPCTPAGVMKMLEYAEIPVAGKECVIVGRSNIVGKPMAMLLLQANGTVTVCHSHTENLEEVTRRADILVAAVGKAHFITADMVKEGAVVIDVGINRLDTGKLAGDVDFAAVSEKAAAITPVPGGVGVMTITMLLENALKAAELQAQGR